MNRIKLILAQMSNVYKPQRQFFLVLMTTLMCFRGKAHFRNLSRYSDYNEKTYSRWFRRDFDFVEFNNLSLTEISNNDNTLIAAVDCSFVNKSGKQTYGLDKCILSKFGGRIRLDS